MRRKALERRSKKYVPVQNVSMINWYMDAEDFYQKYKKSDGAGREGAKPKPKRIGGKDRSR